MRSQKRNVWRNISLPETGARFVSSFNIPLVAALHRQIAGFLTPGLSLHPRARHKFSGQHLGRQPASVRFRNPTGAAKEQRGLLPNLGDFAERTNKQRTN
jgi:hypothetical protein